MKKVQLILITGILCLPAGCCHTFTGYGRYMLRLDCDKVVINSQTYKITRSGDELVVASQTFPRGICRKTRPWLYLHHDYGNKADITFEEGLKDIYPLYTGASSSIFDVYAHPWEMTRSTNAKFSDNYWLVSHRWSDSGIFFDLHQRMGDVKSWRLAQADIFVPSNGSEVTFGEISTKVKIISFDATQKKAMVKFTAE